MPDYTYTVEPDAYGDPTIWKHERENDPSPVPVATDSRYADMHPEAFRAAAAVLAPDDDVLKLVALAKGWHAGDAEVAAECDVCLEEAMSVLAALKAHATEVNSDAR